MDEGLLGPAAPDAALWRAVHRRARRILPSFLPGPRVRPARADVGAPEAAFSAPLRFTWGHCRIPSCADVQMTQTVAELAPRWIAIHDHCIVGKAGACGPQPAEARDASKA